jgi:hypothetical protein
MSPARSKRLDYERLMRMDVRGLRRNTYIFFAVLCAAAVALGCYAFAAVDQTTAARALKGSCIVFFMALTFLMVRLRYLYVVELLRDGPPKSAA